LGVEKAILPCSFAGTVLYIAEGESLLESTHLLDNTTVLVAYRHAYSARLTAFGPVGGITLVM